MRSLHPWLSRWIALLIAALVAPAHAQDAGNRGSLEAKLQYCMTCHGDQGQGYHGYLTIPRLAGQPPLYVENQLRAFADGRRVHPIMSRVARSLSPSLVPALAAHFSRLSPAPSRDAPRRPLEMGKRIYEQGLPDANVPACAVCHGDEARGQRDIPRLAGQLYPYLVGQLVDWGKSRALRPTDFSAIMTPTAHNLSRAQIEAIAAYVSALP